MRYRWTLNARPAQLQPPGNWTAWVVLAGRGFGKTRTGAEWVRTQVESGRCARVGLVGATVGDARDIMIEGESGLLAVCPPWNRPRYSSTKRRLTWPNGAIATLYTADEPERLRGKQHDGVWADELASWRYREALDQVMFGLRLGSDPRLVVTTTPKPVAVLKELLAQSTTVVTGGSSYENRDNLAPTFFDYIVAKYKGTRLGQQELDAKLLEDIEGALWRREAMIERYRVTSIPDLVRVVVGVDPAISATGETGIVVAGVAENGHAYVIDDKTALGTPGIWAPAAVAAYNLHKADRLVAEQNQGGLMVANTIGNVDGAPPVALVHASRGKRTRAEPISLLYEQGRVHHVGTFPDLEQQMCEWVPGDESPDRMDALVWALTELMLPETEDVLPGFVVQGRAKGW